MEFSQLLKKLRQDNNLSQKKVSEHLGYGSAQFISNAERGVSFLPMNDVIKLASLFNVSVDFLISKYIQNKVELYELELKEKFKCLSTRKKK